MNTVKYKESKDNKRYKRKEVVVNKSEEGDVAVAPRTKVF